MQNKKTNWNLIISLLSISLSIMVALLWIIKGKELSVVSLDTFIAAIATFIGVIVTLVIGFQIINVLEIRNSLGKIKEENEALTKKIKRLNELEKKLNELKTNTSADLLTAYGFSHANKGRHLRSILCTFQSIITRLNLDIANSQYAHMRIEGEIFNIYTDLTEIADSSFDYNAQIQLNPHWKHNIETFSDVIMKHPQYNLFKTNFNVMHTLLFKLIDEKQKKNSISEELKNDFTTALNLLYKDVDY